jgi:16S rRNA (guanine527-N7)-methyltransferase
MVNIFLEFEANSKILDMWTGWWFPLIPLAIVNPECHFTWLDSVWKKLKAIDEFSQELWLKNIETVHARAEEVWQNPKYREQFDYVVSRATAFLPVLLEYVIPLLKVWWIFVAYKLEDKQELKSAKKILSRLSAKILKVKNYELDGQKRTFILIQKNHITHKKYPRKVWIPTQSPIK